VTKTPSSPSMVMPAARNCMAKTVAARVKVRSVARISSASNTFARSDRCRPSRTGSERFSTRLNEALHVLVQCRLRLGTRVDC
jgi:hypothetical protein